jgi:hypothetical protein
MLGVMLTIIMLSVMAAPPVAQWLNTQLKIRRSRVRTPPQAPGDKKRRKNLSFNKLDRFKAIEKKFTAAKQSGFQIFLYHFLYYSLIVLAPPRRHHYPPSLVNLLTPFSKLSRFRAMIKKAYCNGTGQLAK